LQYLRQHAKIQSMLHLCLEDDDLNLNDFFVSNGTYLICTSMQMRSKDYIRQLSGKGADCWFASRFESSFYKGNKTKHQTLTCFLQ
jgi:hypothetical protein